jgi:MFS family permease
MIPCALATNFETLVICRFFGGFFSSPIFNACANVPDMFQPGDVLGSWALNCWCLSAEVFMLLAPVSSVYILERQGYPWIFW